MAVDCEGENGCGCGRDGGVWCCCCCRLSEVRCRCCDAWGKYEDFDAVVVDVEGEGRVALEECDVEVEGAIDAGGEA